MGALNPGLKVVRCLAPRRPTEENNYALSRQMSAMNVLCKMDKWDMDWTQAMSEELARTNGLETIILFLE